MLDLKIYELLENINKFKVSTIKAVGVYEGSKNWGSLWQKLAVGVFSIIIFKSGNKLGIWK